MSRKILDKLENVRILDKLDNALENDGSDLVFMKAMVICIIVIIISVLISCLCLILPAIPVVILS